MHLFRQKKKLKRCAVGDPDISPTIVNVEAKQDADDKPSLLDDPISWLLGYESTRFKAFLKSHGEEKITSIKACRVPISSVVNLGFDILSEGSFNQAKKKLGIDNFFHSYIVINGSYLIEKNETINYKSYSKPSNEESIDIPLGKKDITIDDFIKTASRGNARRFWLDYNPLSNNCQLWVKLVLSKNGLFNSQIQTFVNQDMEALLKELKPETDTKAKTITDVASVINRIIQKTTGGRLGFAIGGRISNRASHGIRNKYIR